MEIFLDSLWDAVKDTLIVIPILYLAYLLVSYFSHNDNEKYSCWINFEIPLDDVFQGTTMKAKTTNGQKYVFFRE